MDVKQNGSITLELPASDLEWQYIPDIVYADYGGCKRHIQLIAPYKPDWNGERFPLIVYVPGSAWFAQYKYSKLPMLGRLAERGYAVAAVEYRESSIAPFPAQICDVKAAIRFLRSKAEEFHLDTERVFSMGDSSGGHTVLLAGLTASMPKLDSDLYPGYSCEVSGIIDFYAPADLVKCHEESPKNTGTTNDLSPIELLLGGVKLQSVPELAREASCFTYIDKAIPVPPVLIFHGTNDDTVLHNQSVLLFDKLKEAGKEAAFYSVQGAGHGGAVYWCSEIVDIVDEFIKNIE
ncbi:MAG TPA: alpha/beta hydrolase [Clostridia bacterium]|nr:alpha/beta hydrolase [Clostridia bacterium]